MDVLMMPPRAAPPEPSIFMKVDMTKISTASPGGVAMVSSS